MPGRSSGDESKKPLPSSSRTPAANASSFGFKKQSGSAAGLVITASGATVTSRSATLGKIPKSSALVGRSRRKTSMDRAQNQDDGPAVSQLPDELTVPESAKAQ